MKHLLLLLILLAISCQNKPAAVAETEATTTETPAIQPDSGAHHNLSVLPSDWICLTEKDGGQIIFNSCDGGNMLITISEQDNTLLLHGQQEDSKFAITKTVASDNGFVIKTKGLDGEGNQDFEFKWSDKSKGLGRWSTLYNNPERWEWDYLFVSSDHEKDFKVVNQPCKECWGDECDDIVEE